MQKMLVWMTNDALSADYLCPITKCLYVSEEPRSPRSQRRGHALRRDAKIFRDSRVQVVSDLLPLVFTCSLNRMSSKMFAIGIYFIRGIIRMSGGILPGNRRRRLHRILRLRVPNEFNTSEFREHAPTPLSLCKRRAIDSNSGFSSGLVRAPHMKGGSLTSASFEVPPYQRSRSFALLPRLDGAPTARGKPRSGVWCLVCSWTKRASCHFRRQCKT